jgi:FlaA1/EpsC-like NDP-sugar epimerase
MIKILITGGTGFLGKRLGKKLKEMGYAVTLTGRNNKQNLLAANYSNCEAIAMDVSRIESVRDIFNQIKPDIVIHAAATKFVDISEKQPMESIDVNVLGSQNVARIAIENGVKVVIGISTDKASPPVRNMYGLTKSIMERLFCSMDKISDCRFLCVRYGNVAWSTGSVLPIWKKMASESGILSTTGPQMIRYFFTVDEAVQLVVTALEHVDEIHGKVLSRKMKSAKMEDILKIWVKRDGISYKQVEGRPGERSIEYLIGELELPYTEEKEINGLMHYIISFNQEHVNNLVEAPSSENAERLSEQEILAIINNPPPEEE